MQKKKSKLRKILPWVGFALLALVLAILPRLARSVETGEKASILTATAAMGEVENTLGGGGTLTAEDPIELEIPSAVDIQEFLVNNGDHVEAGQPLAKVDRVTMLSALSEAQDSINILTEKMQVALRDAEYSWIQSQAVGRVKGIYAKTGDDAAQVVVEHGALAVVSIDGLMVTKIPTDLPIQAGEKLTARLSDGQEVSARVESKLDGVLSVILSDKEPAIGESVTVLTEDGAVVGTGFLDVHSPWNVIATQGNIANVVVTQDQMVYAGTRMICLSFENGNEEYRSLVTKRRQYEDLMKDLFTFYNDDTIKAPEAGFVGGIDKSIIKNTAALDKKPVLKLLAAQSGGGRTPVQDQDNNLKTNYLVTSVNKLGDGALLVGVPFTGEISVLKPDGILDVLKKSPAAINLGAKELKITAPKYKPGDELFGPEIGDIIQVDKIDQGTNPTKLQWLGRNIIEEAKALNNAANTTPAVQDFNIEDFELDIGDFVMDMGGAGEAKDEDAALLQKTTVMTVIPDTSMTVTMDVDELDIAYYEPGQKADILVDALPNQSFTAVVEEVSAVGKNSGGNSKYTVKLRLDRAPDMLNGMNASVVVHRGVTSGLVLPAAAVYDRGSQCFVYTAADKKTGTLIGELPVVTGVSDGEMVEIVSGLAEGQAVFYEYYLPVEEGN